MSSTSQTSILYRLKPGWGLPSLSIASLQTEAYLRLAKVDFVIQDCPWSSFSPTARLPSLDTQIGQLIGSLGTPDSIQDEFTNAKAIISYIKKQPNGDLDAALSKLQRSELLAFTMLLESKLIPALLRSTWCESDAYSRYTRTAFGNQLSFPLNIWLPYVARSSIQKYLASLDINDGIYDEASKALDAVASRLELEAQEGSFFLGSRPSSIDALLYACLLYLKSSPVIHPSLRDAYSKHPIFDTYVNTMAKNYFSISIVTTGATSTDLKWSKVRPSHSSTTGSGSTNGNTRPKKTARELEMERKGRIWLFVAGGAIVSYMLLSGQYIEVQQLISELGEDDDGEGFD